MAFSHKLRNDDSVVGNNTEIKNYVDIVYMH